MRAQQVPAPSRNAFFRLIVKSFSDETMKAADAFFLKRVQATNDEDTLSYQAQQNKIQQHLNLLDAACKLETLGQFIKQVYGLYQRYQEMHNQLFNGYPTPQIVGAKSDAFAEVYRVYLNEYLTFLNRCLALHATIDFKKFNFAKRNALTFAANQINLEKLKEKTLADIQLFKQSLQIEHEKNRKAQVQVQAQAQTQAQPKPKPKPKSLPVSNKMTPPLQPMPESFPIKIFTPPKEMPNYFALVDTIKSELKICRDTRSTWMSPLTKEEYQRTFTIEEDMRRLQSSYIQAPQKQETRAIPFKRTTKAELANETDHHYVNLTLASLRFHHYEPLVRANSTGTLQHHLENVFAHHQYPSQEIADAKKDLIHTIDFILSQVSFWNEKLRYGGGTHSFTNNQNIKPIKVPKNIALMQQAVHNARRDHTGNFTNERMLIHLQAIAHQATEPGAEFSFFGNFKKRDNATNQFYHLIHQCGSLESLDQIKRLHDRLFKWIKNSNHDFTATKLLSETFLPTPPPRPR